MNALNGELHWVKGRFNYSYILVGESLVVIDVDFPSVVPKIISYVQGKLKRRISDIKLIIATHWHIDHIAGIDELVNKTNAQLGAHPIVQSYYLKENSVSLLSFPEVIRSAVFVPQEHFSFPSFKDLFSMPLAGLPLPIPFIERNRIQTELTYLLDDGQTVPYCKGWKIIHTPGHTKDSLCLYNEQHEALIAGDVLIHRGGMIRENTDVLIWDKSQYRETIKKLQCLKVRYVFPAFGGPIPGFEGWVSLEK